MEQETARFSTLYRVEGCAARIRTWCWRSRIRVSVPSIGSKAVQHPERPQQPLHPHVSVPSIGSKAVQHMRDAEQLQISRVSVPSIGSKAVQPDRGVGDRHHLPVSVPSIGSKAVQQGRQDRAGRQDGSFSTLYRVEGCAATAITGKELTDHVRFSTLYRVEGLSLIHI